MLGEFFVEKVKSQKGKIQSKKEDYPLFTIPVDEINKEAQVMKKIAA